VYCLFLAVVVQQAYHFICSGHVLFSTCMLQSAGLMSLVGAACFPISVSNNLSLCLLQFNFKNAASILQKLYFFEWAHVLNQSFVSVAEWHITLPVYRHCIKIIIYDNISCLCLQTSEIYVKLSIIFVWKLLKIVSENNFWHMYYSNFSGFWKFMFYTVVKWHSWSVVGYLTTALLLIVHKMW